MRTTAPFHVTCFRVPENQCTAAGCSREAETGKRQCSSCAARQLAKTTRHRATDAEDALKSKPCKACKKKQRLTSFNRSPTADGRDSVCKSCRKRGIGVPRKTKGCRTCEGMKHRRAQPECTECGQPYEPENVEALRQAEREARRSA